MMSREDADIALEAFAQIAGISPLRLDQSGTALLAFGEKHEMIFCHSSQTDQLQMWCPLGDVSLSGSDDTDGKLLRYLLEKNFPATALNGAYFAMDAEMGVVLLGLTVVVNTHDGTGFADTVKAFAKQVIAISPRIEKDIAAHAATRRAHDVLVDDIPVIKA